MFCVQSVNAARRLTTAANVRAAPIMRTQRMNYSPYKNSFFHKDMEIQKAAIPKPHVPYDQLIFGKQFTDHMFEVDWTKEEGWGKPRIVPYHDISLPPSCSVFHYAIQCFEGLKAYSDEAGKNHYLFRPEKNTARFNTSCKRIGLPAFDEGEFLKCLAELVKLEQDWIPNHKGYSLYMRPTAISTEPTLGVLPPTRAKIFIICSPVGPYFRSGFKPIKLYADPKYIRAAPGGTGGYKVGANYGPTILPQLEASEKGYAQVLWLYGANKLVSEVGTMNMFFFWKNKNGELELVTAPLDGTVLPGVTRDSVISIAKEWGIKVEERAYTIYDVIDAVIEDRMIEAFGAGTACIVAPVQAIHYAEKDFKIPVPTAESSLATKLFNHVLSIQHGEAPHPYNVNIEKILSGEYHP